MDGFGRQRRMDRFGNQTRFRKRNHVSKTNDSDQNYRLDCCDDVMDDAAYCNGVHTSSHSSGCCSCTQVSYPMDFLGQGFQMYYICRYTCMSALAGCCGMGGGRAGYSGARDLGTGRFFRKGGRVRRRR